VTDIAVAGEYRRTTEARFGNELLYVEAVADEKGEIPLRVEYLVTRRALARDGAPVDHASAETFLTGSALVPVNGSILRRFFEDMPPEGATLEVARQLYDRVENHLAYDKSGEGWGRGDVAWACDSRYGNCSDFHSVFISLCRDLGIPARFEMGFPLPADAPTGEIGGYHCWARFRDGDRWIGVDISEADKHPERKDFYFGNLPPDRVMFTMERDLELAPQQAAGPVNFLIYPYVEVEGTPHAPQRRKFTFADVSAPDAET
jgi:transglutaminase-like putative cysteine protease